MIFIKSHGRTEPNRIASRNHFLEIVSRIASIHRIVINPSFPSPWSRCVCVRANSPSCFLLPSLSRDIKDSPHPVDLRLLPSDLHKRKEFRDQAVCSQKGRESIRERCTGHSAVYFVKASRDKSSRKEKRIDTFISIPKKTSRAAIRVVGITSRHLHLQHRVAKSSSPSSQVKVITSRGRTKDTRPDEDIKRIAKQLVVNTDFEESACLCAPVPVLSYREQSL